MSIDVVDIKSAIVSKKLSVIVQDRNILLGDNQTGERVKVGSVISVERKNGCKNCREAESGFDVSWSTEDPQGFTSTNHYDKANFCPFCGRKLVDWQAK